MRCHRRIVTIIIILAYSLDKILSRSINQKVTYQMTRLAKSSLHTRPQQVGSTNNVLKAIKTKCRLVHTSQLILRDRVYCIICPDLLILASAQCPILLIRKQNAMILITPKPPTSASCFLKMLLLPISCFLCSRRTLALSQHLKSFRLLLFVTVWGDLNAGFHQLWNPLAGEEGSLPTGNADSRVHIASAVVLSSRAGKLYLTAATLRGNGSRTRATVETLSGLMT